ncbi:PKD domain-containing protein [bacterium]|nr:PKD domain-containing protein [bacterium]
MSNDPDGEIVMYEWDWDKDGVYDHNSGNNPVVQHIYELSGDYETEVRVTDDDGETGTASLTIVVNDQPAAQLTADPTAGNYPLSVSFDASGSFDPDGSIVKFEWDWEGDGAYDLDSEATPTAGYVYPAAGVFNATVRVTDDDGASAVDSVVITVSEPPQIDGTLEISTPPTQHAYITGTLYSVFAQSQEVLITGTVSAASFSGSCWLEIGLVTKFTYDQSINVFENPSFMFNQNVFVIVGDDGTGIYVDPVDYNGFSGERQSAGASFDFVWRLVPNIGGTGGLAYLSVDGGPFGPGMPYGKDNWKMEGGWDWLEDENFDESILIAQMIGYGGGTGTATISAQVVSP